MLWDRRKPLNQPPSYGRIGHTADLNPSSSLERSTKRALDEVQAERKDATFRSRRSRAVVQG